MTQKDVCGACSRVLGLTCTREPHPDSPDIHWQYDERGLHGWRWTGLAP